jgi:hypothetical protein
VEALIGCIGEKRNSLLPFCLEQFLSSGQVFDVNSFSGNCKVLGFFPKPVSDINANGFGYGFTMKGRMRDLMVIDNYLQPLFWFDLDPRAFDMSNGAGEFFIFFLRFKGLSQSLNIRDYRNGSGNDQ